MSLKHFKARIHNKNINEKLSNMKTNILNMLSNRILSCFSKTLPIFFLFKFLPLLFIVNDQKHIKIATSLFKNLVYILTMLSKD